MAKIRGATGAPWKALEDDGKRTIRTRNGEEKAGRNTRPVAAGSYQPKNTWSNFNAVTTLIARKMMKQGFSAVKSGDTGKNTKVFSGLK